MDIKTIKDAIDALVALIKDMMKDLSWFIEGFKQKDSFDAE